MIYLICINTFSYQLMSDKPCAIHLQHQDVVHHPYLTALHELHLALVSHHIDRKADAIPLVHVSGLGNKLDVERLALYFSRRLRMNIARNELLAPGVNPLPLLTEEAKVGITLRISLHLIKVFRG